MSLLQEFRARYTPARLNNFKVILGKPNFLKGFPEYSDVSFSSEFTAKAVTLPSKVLATRDVEFQADAVRKIPYNQILEDLSIQFYVTGQQIERKFFLDWLEYIMPQRTQRTNSFTSAYYEDYVTDTVVRTYNGNGIIASEYKFYETYPIAVSQVSHDWENNNSVMTIQVDFAYHTYDYESLLTSID